MLRGKRTACDWCGATIDPPHQFCSDDCARLYASLPWTEWEQQQHLSASGKDTHLTPEQEAELTEYYFTRYAKGGV